MSNAFISVKTDFLFVMEESVHSEILITRHTKKFSAKKGTQDSQRLRMCVCMSAYGDSHELENLKLDTLLVPYRADGYRRNSKRLRATRESSSPWFSPRWRFLKHCFTWKIVICQISDIFDKRSPSINRVTLASTTKTASWREKTAITEALQMARRVNCTIVF